MKQVTKNCPAPASSSRPQPRTSLFRTPSPTPCESAYETFLKIERDATGSEWEWNGSRMVDWREEEEEEARKRKKRRTGSATAVKGRKDTGKGKGKEVEVLELLDSDDDEQSARNAKASSSSSFRPANLPPPPSLTRHQKVNAITTALPDIHPIHVFDLLNKASPSTTVEQIVKELLESDYPLRPGGYKNGGVSRMYVLGTRQAECQSCGDKVELGDFAHCKEGHTFCFPCVQTGAESALGMRRSRVACFASDSDCPEVIDSSQLRRALPANIVQRLEEIDSTRGIDAAGIPGRRSCPFCPFAAVVDKDDSTFECQRAECEKTSCTLCDKEAHGARPCHERLGGALASQHLVEESMSDAVIRKCVGCKAPYIKTDGITCGVCGAHQCYVCGKATESKWHWTADVDWKGRRKCPANDDTELRAYREAEVARRRITTALAYTGDAPPLASTASLGPSLPVRSAAEASRFKNGCHKFLDAGEAFDDSTDSQPAAAPAPPSSATAPAPRRRTAASPQKRPYNDAAAQTSQSDPRSAYRRRSNAAGTYSNDLDAPAYGVKTAGNGVFGAGGRAVAGGGWEGGRGTKADEERRKRERERERAREWDRQEVREGRGRAKDEPEEVKRMRMLQAAQKRAMAE